MRLQKASHMYLDISHRESDWIRGRFPSIADHCRNQGLDMTTQPLPVVPAAHYFCGGVTTDLTGRTTVRGLFAAGEGWVGLGWVRGGVDFIGLGLDSSMKASSISPEVLALGPV